MNNKKIKRIGLFNSGGDCAGLNQAMYAIMKRATKEGIEVYGAMNGDEGFLSLDTVKKLEPSYFDHYFNHSGTVLGSRRGGVITIYNNDFSHYNFDDKIIEKFKENVAALKLDAILFTGGDGTMFATSCMTELVDVPFIGIPKTIDNDTPWTDYSLGFETACNQIVNSMEALSTTSYSHDMVMVVEVMGNSVGHLAINAGIAGRADAILMPEFDYSFDNLYNKIQEKKKAYFKSSLMVVVAEGIKKMPEDDANPKYAGMGAGEYIKTKFVERGDKDVRHNVLGHIQRGGLVAIKDKIRGLEFGSKAVDELLKGNKNIMICSKGEELFTVPLEKLKSGTTIGVSLDSEVVRTAIDLGIYIGETK